MKIVLLTPGTGGYYCGVCMRDNAMAKELTRMGHEALMLPMYLPLTLDEDAAISGPVFFGGINVYLQQKFALFRYTPKWIDAFFNQPWMLKLAGSQSGMTGGDGIGEMTHSMLLGESGHQAKELEKLVGWLQELRPDAVWLSTALLVGVARRIKESLGVPILCSLQGEDSFLDGLCVPWSQRCWQVLSERAAGIDRFIAPSRWFGQFMGGRLQLSEGQLRAIPNGISLEGFGPPAGPPDHPVVGYLARLTEAKGLGLVIEAFILLKQSGRFPNATLRCAGAMTAGDQAYVDSLRQRLCAAGQDGSVEFLPNVTRIQKIAFLGSLSLLSVPALCSEAFGLYLVEAFAAGVPVVQPRSWAYPEIVEAAEAGLLCEPRSAASLCSGWEELLSDPVRARLMGQSGRAAAEGKFSLAAMAARFLEQTREMIDASASAR